MPILLLFAFLAGCGRSAPAAKSDATAGGIGIDTQSARRACRELEFPYAVGVMATDRVWRLDSRGRRIDQAPVAIEDFAIGLGRGAFRKTTWRLGSKAPLSS